MGEPSAVIERLTAAQNAHDPKARLACFDADYGSEPPQLPARTFERISQLRANWSALLPAVTEFRAEVLRSAVDRDIRLRRGPLDGNQR